MDSLARYHWTLHLVFFVTLIPALTRATEESLTVWNQESLLLECNTWNLVEPELKWEKDDEPVPAPGTKRIVQTHNGSLVITNTLKDDSGTYTCYAKSGDAVAETTYHLEVRYLIVRNFSKSVNLIEGNTLELECEVEADKPDDVTITWLRGEKELDTSDGRITISGGDDDDEGSNSVLTIEDVEFDDRAEYACVARLDDVARNSSRVLLRIRGKLAPLWPVIGICLNLLIVVLISFWWDKTRKSRLERGQHED